MSKTSRKIKRQVEQLPTCTVCMERKVNCKPDECSHQFCYRCLSKWGRRRGNCPLCRQRIRKIHYKKKILEPEYLKFFDEESSSEQILLIEDDEETPVPSRRPRTAARPVPPIIRPPILVMPFIPSPYLPFFTPMFYPLPTFNVGTYRQ